MSYLVDKDEQDIENTKEIVVTDAMIEAVYSYVRCFYGEV